MWLFLSHRSGPDAARIVGGGFGVKTIVISYVPDATIYAAMQPKLTPPQFAAGEGDSTISFQELCLTYHHRNTSECDEVNSGPKILFEFVTLQRFLWWKQLQGVGMTSPAGRNEVKVHAFVNLSRIRIGSL